MILASLSGEEPDIALQPATRVAESFIPEKTVPSLPLRLVGQREKTARGRRPGTPNRRPSSWLGTS